MNTHVADTKAPLADVAISVASANKAIAEDLAGRLRARGVRAFFYEHSPEQMLGTDLEQRLREIYGSAPLVVIVHSRRWRTDHTQVELTAALEGAAGRPGVIALRTDDEDLPDALIGTVFWSAEQGLGGLANALSLRLGRRPLRGPVAHVIAAMLSVGAAYVMLGALGFRDPTRLPDGLFWAAALLPLSWVAVFDLLPALGERRRRRRTGGVVLRTGLERVLDRLASTARWGLLLATLVAIAWAVRFRSDRIVEAQAVADLRADLSAMYHEYRNDLTKVTTVASRAQLGVSPTAPVRAAFRTAVEAQRSSGAALRRRFEGADVPAGAEERKELANDVEALARTADRHLGHQLDELVRLEENGDPSARAPSIRATLTRWNGFFADSMGTCEAHYANLDDALASYHRKLAEDWRGLGLPAPRVGD